MSQTATVNNAVADGGLTLETLRAAIDAARQGWQGTIWYRASVGVPPRLENGEPAFFAMPELALGSWAGRSKTGRVVVLLHPDNLLHLQKACDGVYRLEEWVPTP